jgi:hypothetical protein
VIKLPPRSLVAVVLVVPLLVVVLLSTPTWLAWPFLGSDRRIAVLSFVDRLVEWVKALAGNG